MLKITLKQPNTTSFFKGKYHNPTFQSKFKGHVLKKDLYINNILLSHFGRENKSTKTHKAKRRNLTEVILTPKSVIISRNSQNEGIKDYFDKIIERNKTRHYLKNPLLTKYGDDYFNKTTSHMFTNTFIRKNLNTLSTLDTNLNKKEFVLPSL